MRIIYNKYIDEENIETFNNKINNTTANKYKCVICGCPTSIEKSFSDNGLKLIDKHCVRKFFTNENGLGYAGMFAWQQGIITEI